MLRDMGHEVDAEGDGPAALKRLKARRPATT